MYLPSEYALSKSQAVDTSFQCYYTIYTMLPSGVQMLDIHGSIIIRERILGRRADYTSSSWTRQTRKHNGT